MLSLVLRRPRAATLALAAVLTGVPQGIAGAQAPFSSLTIFGDSFSDSGNLFQATGQPGAPYFMGRLSNGPVWVEYFATALGRPTDGQPAFLLQRPSGNYAVAAARTAPVPNGAPSTGEQIARYLTRPGAGLPPTDPTGLYVLFGGGNDLRDIGGLPDPTLRLGAALATAQRIGDQARALVNAGARSILIPNLPLLGSTPEALVTPGRSAIMNEITSVFNTALVGQLASLRAASPGVNFFDLHLDVLFANILADARTGGGRYGFTNTTLPCLPPFAPAGAPSCDVSVFVDAFHPTTKAHQVIADAAYARVVNGTQVAVIPEPATMVLFGSGLALLVAGGTIRRRRAAAHDAA